MVNRSRKRTTSMHSPPARFAGRAEWWAGAANARLLCAARVGADEDDVAGRRHAHRAQSPAVRPVRTVARRVVPRRDEVPHRPRAAPRPQSPLPPDAEGVGDGGVVAAHPATAPGRQGVSTALGSRAVRKWIRRGPRT
eukprot:gene2370-biopygen1420